MYYFCWGVMPPFLFICPEVLPSILWASSDWNSESPHGINEGKNPSSPTLHCVNIVLKCCDQIPTCHQKWKKRLVVNKFMNPGCTEYHKPVREMFNFLIKGQAHTYLCLLEVYTFPPTPWFLHDLGLMQLH